MKFLVDRMLGKLAKGLRILGYDAAYYRGEDPNEFFRLARQEKRVILTRNTRLVPKQPEDRVVRVTVDQPVLQLKELIRTGWVCLNEEILFSRCLLCNALIEEIPREEAEGKIPDFIFCQKQAFFRCPQCLRIYWQGSHPERMRQRIDRLLRREGA